MVFTKGSFTGVHSPLLDEASSAEYLRLSRSTLQKMRVVGGGPAYVKLGRRVRYPIKDLDSWLMARRRNSTSESYGTARRRAA